MKKRMTVMIIFLVLVFGGLIGFNIFKQKMMAKYFANFSMPPATISTVKVERHDWLPTIASIGNFTAVNGVDVNSQQSGLITKLNFISGDYVEAGKLLIEIDHSIDDASLEEAKATLALGKLNYERQKELYAKNATSESNLDSARTTMQQNAASVEKIEATINQKKIRAPFTGKLGVRLINLGEYVQPGSTKIVSLQSLDPLFLQFYLPEHHIKQLHLNQEIIFTVRSYPKYHFKGTINAINSKIDTNSHNILVQAKVENCPHPHSSTSDTLDSNFISTTTEPTSGIEVTSCNSDTNLQNKVREFAFMPGMFAKLDVVLPAIKNVMVVPRSAINYSLYGNSVYVVREETDKKTKKPIKKVFQQFIKTGDERGTKVVILSGIKVGDEIVNSGQLKLQNGTPVIINNDVKVKPVKHIDSLGQ